MFTCVLDVAFRERMRIPFFDFVVDTDFSMGLRSAFSSTSV